MLPEEMNVGEKNRAIDVGIDQDCDALLTTGDVKPSGQAFASGDAAFTEVEETSISKAMADSLEPLKDPKRSQSNHSQVLMLALIEEKCRSEACRIINANRAPADALQSDHTEVARLSRTIFDRTAAELRSAGMISAEETPLADDDNLSLRANYREQLNLALNMIGSKQYLNPKDGREQSPRTLSTTVESILPLHDEPRDLVKSPQSFQEHSLRDQPYDILVDEQNRRLPWSSSKLASDYDLLRVIGKGGFGQVLQVRDLHDKQEYAIKKIRLRHKDWAEGGCATKAALQAVLDEVQYHASLDHRNISRYLHCWFESPLEQLGAGNDFESKALTFRSGHAKLEASEVPEDPSFNIVFGSSSQVINQAATFSDVVNSNDSLSDEASSSTHHPTSSRKAMKHDPSLSNGARSSETESSQSSSDATKQDKSSTPFDAARSTDVGMGHDARLKPVVALRKAIQMDSQFTSLGESNSSSMSYSTSPHTYLYVKQKLYPMTLRDYLLPIPLEHQTNLMTANDAEACQELYIRHCFHTLPTVNIILALLDGLEYCHDRNVVHRDIKPANIFLQLHPQCDNHVQAREGLNVNILDCPECHGVANRAMFMTPCIGDFGLATTVTETSTEPESVDELESQTNALTLMKPGNARPVQVGTQLYCRPTSQFRNDLQKVGPGLDIYSLAIVAAELIMKFGTTMERINELVRVRDGDFPARLAEHRLGTGIAMMLRTEEEGQWSCNEIRGWLQEVRQECVQQQGSPASNTQ